MLPGKRPVVLLTWHKDRAFYFNYQKNFLLFSCFPIKDSVFGSKRVIFLEFSI
nr:MAG TPA_asm: hypothetical protein [Bacteriophage sp.]